MHIWVNPWVVVEFLVILFIVSWIFDRLLRK